MNVKDFRTGVIVGALGVFLLAKVNVMGAQTACKDLHHVKCTLLYVPLPESTDGKTHG